MSTSIIEPAPTFQRLLYEDWYAYLNWEMKGLPAGTKIELGSGDGFFKEVAPSVVCSDVQAFPTNDLTFSGHDMPFNAESVSGIFMIDTFSCIPDSLALLTEIDRVLVPGGKVIMIEPANTIWGRFAHRWLGRRSFSTKESWHSSHEQSSDNAARPWVVFQRDRTGFDHQFPRLVVEDVHYHTPLRHLLSGCPLLKSVASPEAYRLVSAVDSWLSRRSWQFSMFMTVVVRKEADAP